MKWHTPLDLNSDNNRRQITHQDSLLFMGSCFSENIGSILVDHKFDTNINPLGISYNPVSLARQIAYLSDQKYPQESQFVSSPKGMVHFDFHGDFSFNDASTGALSIKKSLADTSALLKKATYLFITYGTAIIYKHHDFGVVNNCHKIDNTEFTKDVLSFDVLKQSITESIEHFRKINPNLQLVFTISPVRHVRHGLTNDRLSKSLLIAAVHEVIKDQNQCSYFPSYELLTDDLRDYRFYKEDMIHPNQQAIKYIWDFFTKAFFSSTTQTIVKEVQSISQSLKHRPMQKDSVEHRDFLLKLKSKMEALVEKGIDFDKEI